MNPRIEQLPATKLVGKRLQVSLAQNRTAELWRSFMPHRNEILHRVSPNLFSLQHYGEALVAGTFHPEVVFEKWAAAEVSAFEAIPAGMETLELPGGLYAVFLHKGLPSDFPRTWQFILNTWLPQSPYELDHRAHFELLGETYKNNDPDSEEEIWVPIR